jgi:hypothetical protein
MNIEIDRYRHWEIPVVIGAMITFCLFIVSLMLTIYIDKNQHADTRTFLSVWFLAYLSLFLIMSLSLVIRRMIKIFIEYKRAQAAS